MVERETNEGIVERTSQSCPVGNIKEVTGTNPVSDWTRTECFPSAQENVTDKAHGVHYTSEQDPTKDKPQGRPVSKFKARRQQHLKLEQ